MEKKEIEIYELLVEDGKFEGKLDAISLVSDPAMESHAIFLSNETNIRELKFSSDDDAERQEITGLAMRPNKKILRYRETLRSFLTGEKEPYNIFFSPQTVRKCAKILAKNKAMSNLNFEHIHDRKMEGYIYESWIVEDPKYDKATMLGLKDVIKNDWFVTAAIDSKSDFRYYKKMYDDKKSGWSIEGIFAEIFDPFINEKELLEKQCFKAVQDILGSNLTDFSKLDLLRQLSNSI